MTDREAQEARQRTLEGRLAAVRCAAGFHAWEDRYRVAGRLYTWEEFSRHNWPPMAIMTVEKCSWCGSERDPDMLLWHERARTHLSALAGAVAAFPGVVREKATGPLPAGIFAAACVVGLAVYGVLSAR